MTTHLIGCGGVATYFLPPFLRTLRYGTKLRLRNTRVVLHDGDTVEDRNLQRQNFQREHLDSNKAVALARMFPWYDNLGTVTRYIDGSFGVADGDTIIIAADNHLARRHALAAADRAAGVHVLSAANSTIGAEA